MNSAPITTIPPSGRALRQGEDIWVHEPYASGPQHDATLLAAEFPRPFVRIAGRHRWRCETVLDWLHEPRLHETWRVGTDGAASVTPA